jgi:hypothetical protein
MVAKDAFRNARATTATTFIAQPLSGAMLELGSEHSLPSK